MKTENVRLASDELVGFDRFVQFHYQESMKKAMQIVAKFRTLEENKENDRDVQEWALHIFDKLASPLVFLKAAWRNELSSEDRKSFYLGSKKEKK